MLNDLRRAIGCASDVIPNVDAEFEKACLVVVIEAFKYMKQDKLYDLTWKETRYSAHLIRYMRKVRDCMDLRLQIDPECYLYQADILGGKKDPDTAPRIDIKILGGWVKENIYYAIEAKILVAEDWRSRKNYQLRARYIETGIDNFVSGRYSPDIPRGCVLGYVVQGIPPEIVQKINDLLVHRRREAEQLTNRHTINGYPDCYQSEHTRVTDQQTLYLHHILLVFC
jgi:hypothetical protein